MADVQSISPQDTALANSHIRESAKRTRQIFTADFGLPFSLADTPLEDDASHKSLVTSKIRSEYDDVRELPPALAAKQAAAASARKGAKKQKLQPKVTDDDGKAAVATTKLIEGIPAKVSDVPTGASQALTLRRPGAGGAGPSGAKGTAQRNLPSETGMIRRDAAEQVKPVWHAPWKLMRVISGHLGWVRSIEVEPNNQWFCTGAGDRTIKIWDLASGSLRLTLTGHISTVRGLAVSPRHPYLFSCAEDKMVKCWDLEQNKVIRHYHGHLSGVYALALHPNLNVLVTTGRDAVARVWDMRTRASVMVLTGHKGTVGAVRTQEADPQVITGSMDSTIRLWDLAAAKTMAVLTHHKKAVRTLAIHPKEFTFASGSADNIKQWKCPEGAFMQNFEGNKGIVNTLSVNEDDVMFAGSDNGEIGFYDWKSGYKFQGLETIAQPGSLEAEQGVFTSTFDKTGLRLITGEADKTIKIWKQDEDATEETHPLDWKPSLLRRRY
ncbi:pre-mRNA-splicing factor prp46 [Orbilia oligospora]|uniref:Pre-mRNA-splicing factor PRP46 n=1 Tax=Orbilia oligospora TaxID=2813651 RepID=A0A6G1M037_ORBOL|nr:pre-mRNA-splicing factor prp46 [Orbilia oligospora]KAF3238753.1 pre-mRNA-splicing factor prp46 [Orbilia oligospora]